GRAQQRLGGNTAPIRTDAGHVLALDDGGLHAELGSTDGGDVAAGSGADDDEIVCVSHGVPLETENILDDRHQRRADGAGVGGVEVDAVGRVGRGHGPGVEEADAVFVGALSVFAGEVDGGLDGPLRPEV